MMKRVSTAANGLELSPVTQVLIEQSIAGLRIEFEVMRISDNALIVAQWKTLLVCSYG